MVYRVRWNLESPNTIDSGEVDDDINFTYEDNNVVDGSCAASLHDEMWVLGGSNKKRQVNVL